MGSCDSCIQKRVTQLPKGEVFMQEFEANFPSMHRDHAEWVSALRQVYSGGGNLNADQLKKANQRINFSLDEFCLLIPSDYDVFCDLLQGSKGLYGLKRFLAFTIHFSAGSFEDKLSTFLYSLTLGQSDIVKVEHLTSQLEFMMEVSLRIIPQEAKRKYGKPEVIKYAKRLLIVKRNIVKFFVRLLCGHSTEVGIEDLSRMLTCCKDGRNLMSASKLRLMANDLFKMHKLQE
jgi:hypothetical protein